MSEETERITILLQAKDRDMQRVIERNNRLIARFERDATRATTTAARNIDRNLNDSAQSFAAWGKAGVASVALIAASLTGGAMRNAINALGDLSDRANRVGIDVEAFQGLQRGFQLAGVQADQFGTSMEMFTQRLGEAADGAGPLADVLRANGVALRDQNGEIRPTLDLLRDFAGIIANTPTQAEKLALLNDAFGRSGRALAEALSGGPEAIDEFIRAAIEGGYVMDRELVQRGEELGDKFDDLSLKVGNFFKALAVGAGEAGLGLKLMAEDLAALAADSVTAEPISVDEAGMTALRQIGADAEELAGYLDRTANDLRRIGVEGYENLNAAASEMRRLNAGLIDGTISGDQFDNQMRIASETALGLMLSLDDIDQQQFGNVIASLGGLISGLVSAAQTAAVARSEIARMAAAGSTSLPALSGPAGGFISAPTGSGQPVAPGVRPEARPLDIDFGYSGPASTGSGGPSGGGSSPREAEPAYWDDLVQSVQDAQDQLEAFNDAADAGADKMSDLFMSILDGSKSAKEALSDLLIELAQVQLKSGLLGLFDNLGGGSGGGILSAIGSAFGGGRAKGGSVLSGKTYLVGEQGPELFSPGSSGMITPNHKLGGGSSQNIVYNIDARGAEAGVEQKIAAALRAYDDQKFSNARIISDDPWRAN